jgi:uncharacterized membrane protein
MAESVERYLDDLRRALAGSDPATVQDALSDAEEHLRTALEQALGAGAARTEREALEMIVERYGTPEETAAAYREIEARVAPSMAPAQGEAIRRSGAGRFLGVLADPRAYAALLYMIFALVTGIVYFSWTVTGLSLSIGLIILIIGIPVLGAFLLSVRGIALIEGRIVEALLGVRMPRRPLFSQKHLGAWQRFKALFKDRITWTAIIYMIVQLPLGIIYFTLFIVMISFSLRLIGSPIIDLVFDLPVAIFGNVAYYLPGWFIPIAVLIGIFWFVLTLHLARLIARMHGAIARRLLLRGTAGLEG